MVKKLGERLVEAGLITGEAVEQALQHQKITGHKLGECLVEIGKIQETVLLRFLAGELNTRFVSAEKLSKARIPPNVLDKVPVRMAETQHFIPVAMDEERKILSIVASEPQNEALLSELSLVTGIQEVYAFVGLRSAIQAAIRKHYYGDPTAFQALESGQLGPAIQRADIAAMSSAVESNSTEARARAALAPGLRLETDPRMRPRGGGGTQISHPTQHNTMLREVLGITRSAVADNDYAETLNILVGMLELQRRELRGHSSQLARYAVLVAKRLGMPPKEVSQVATAAYLHDLGKPPDKHFTVASNAVNGDWKSAAKRAYRAPIKLFETVNLPGPVNTMLAQLYEAYDGSGVPQGAKGDDIILGARILAAVDSYLDLMKNSGNATGRPHSRDEALAHLTDNAGVLYDPMVVDVIAQMHSGDLLRQRLQTEGRQIVVADPEETVRVALRDAISKQGMVTLTLSTMDGAVDAALGGDADVLVLGMRFGLREILGLVELMRAQPGTAGVPVVVVGIPTEQQGREALARYGVLDVLPMPLDAEAGGKRIVELYRDRVFHGGPARPVRGSLDEMSQAELLRVLGKAHKSGRLTLRHEGREGYYHLEQGKVVFAAYAGQAGPQALRAMYALKEADFTYDADSILSELPQFSADVEMLLKELAAPRS
jgi:response regulator RpfG family c-di-GMP phosphodiesterase